MHLLAETLKGPDREAGELYLCLSISCRGYSQESLCSDPTSGSGKLWGTPAYSSLLHEALGLP